jgi:site-specific recombinase XerC
MPPPFEAAMEDIMDEGKVSASRRLDGSPIEPSLAAGVTREEAHVPPAEPPMAGNDWRRGPHGRAKIIDMSDVPALLRWAELHEQVPEAAVVKLSLAFYAGLRACEVSRLRWHDVTDSLGRIGRTLVVPPRVAKGGRPREVPIHPCLRWALGQFHERFPEIEHLALCKPNLKPQNPNNVKVWFHRLFRRMGLKGCSSHSGRRSLITFLANNHGQLGMSLRDVQLIAGHASLDTTQAYIEPSRDLHRLIESVPWLPWTQADEAIPTITGQANDGGRPPPHQGRLSPGHALDHFMANAWDNRGQRIPGSSAGASEPPRRPSRSNSPINAFKEFSQ